MRSSCCPTWRSTVRELRRRQSQANVPCSYDGYVIGDGILFYSDENKLVFVGRAPPPTGSSSTPQTGGYNVESTTTTAPLAPDGQAGRPQVLSLSDPGPECRSR